MARALVATVLLGAALAACAYGAGAVQNATRTKMLTVYVGTYTGPGSKGIYRMQLDPATGRLTEPALAAETPSPSFLALSPGGDALYACNELATWDGKPGGGVSAFRVGPADGALTPLNAQPSQGLHPCHLTVDPSGRVVLVANYSSGTFASFPVQPGGALGPAASVVKQNGSGPNKGRQEGPHAHGIYPAPGSNRVAAVDLGIDRVLLFELDPAAATLTPADPPHAAIDPGSGPRHLAFSPNGRFAYVINELLSTVTVCRWDARRGALTPQQTLSTLPEGYTGSSTTSEIAVHPSGRWVYGSNRGQDSIAVYAANARTGALKLVEIAPLGGKTPRGFAVDPTGAYLVAGAQDSDTVMSLRIDPRRGTLTPTGHAVRVGKPVCVIFAPGQP